MQTLIRSLDVTALRTLFLGLALAASTPILAADQTAVGMITHFSVGKNDGSGAPTIGIAIKPTRPECFYGFMFIPVADTAFDTMVTAAAIAAQAGSNAVSITFDDVNGCAIKQFAVLTP